MKKFFLGLSLLCLVSCRGAGPSPHPAPVDRRAAEEAQEAKEYQAFLRQGKKDELQKLTENSFFDARMNPLAGRPVLLAAGVSTWDDQHNETDESPDVVKFEVLRGKGSLVFFTECIPGQPIPGPPKTELRTLAMEGYEAFVWLITDPDSRDEVVVRATLDPTGMRAAFIDPKSEVLFNVRPASIPEADKGWDIRKVRAQTSLNDSAPHGEVSDNFIFTYPSSIGVFKRDPTATLYGADGLRVLHRDPKGGVAEDPDWEEKRASKMERQKWHQVPPDLQGFLTHVDEAGGRVGALSYSQYDPLYGGPGNDQFQQGRWELGEYLRDAPEAGPEDLTLLKTGEEDPGTPVSVEISRVHRSHLERRGPVPYWGETTSWISSTSDLYAIFKLECRELLFFQAQPPPPLQELRKRLERLALPTPEPLDHAIVEGFLTNLGFSFGDITPDREGPFRKLGHPPGALVLKVRPNSPAASVGLHQDDVILMVDWELISSASKLQKLLQDRKSSDPIPFVYWRQGSYHQGTFTFTNSI